jgi:hypothetical protein
VGLQSLGIATFEALASFVSPGDAANLAAVARSVEARPFAVGAWIAVSAALAARLHRAAVRGASAQAFTAAVALIAATTALVSTTFFRDLARSQSIAPFARAATAAVPDSAALYYYPGRGKVAELSFARSFEYAATFYARRTVTVIDDIEDVRDAERFVLILPLPSLSALERLASDAGPGRAYSLREIARHTYGGNPRRVPVVAVEARASGAGHGAGAADVR